jgi:hypothetical protein
MSTSEITEGKVVPVDFPKAKRTDAAPATDAAAVIQPPPSKGLFQIQPPSEEDTLLGNRYLCRGGGMVIVGPTGVGKSSLSMQAMISFALGRECLGIKPARPLKSVLIQAENDEGDLYEMREGVLRGLRSDGVLLNDADKALIGENVIIVSCSGFQGAKFAAEILAPTLDAQQPDLVWIDPAFAFVGGENNSSAEVGTFLRLYLNPLLHKSGAAAVVIHHTNKPKADTEQALTGNELAYLIAGSAEWANWARAIIGLQSTGLHDMFRLTLGKRGGRLGWKDDDGATVYSKYIVHSKDGGIHWRETTEEEVEASGGRTSGKAGRKDTHPAEAILDYMKATNHEVTKAEVQKWFVEKGWSLKTVRTKWEKLVTEKRVQQSVLDAEMWRIPIRI